MKFFKKIGNAFKKPAKWVSHAVSDVAHTTYNIGKNIVNKADKLGNAVVGGAEGISSLLQGKFLPYLVLGGGGLFVVYMLMKKK